MDDELEYRTYGDARGDAGLPVVLLHGGPGAAGYLAPVGRVLARTTGRGFRVWEPFQRRAGGHAPLTVARHVADLHAFVRRVRRAHGGRAPALVGASWGAMLALAYAAEHPDDAACLALVGCGTFDAASRAEYRRRVLARTTREVEAELRRADRDATDPDDRLRRRARVHERVQSHDPFVWRDETVWVDARGHDESWDDMLRLQADGVYPAAFARVRCPVLMLHGDEDPHPGALIRASLAPHVARLAYHELARCGHEPWRERSARGEFFGVLEAWLAECARRVSPSSPPGRAPPSSSPA